MEERYQKMVATSTTVQVVVLGVGATSYGTIMIPEYICTVVPIQTYRQAIITLQALQIVCISVQWTSRSHTHGLPDRADLESGRFVLYDVETHRENHALGDHFCTWGLLFVQGKTGTPVQYTTTCQVHDRRQG